MRYLLLLVVAVAAHGQYGAATSIVSGNGAPVAAQCTNANNVGRVWARKDGGAASTTFYICAATGAGTYGWQLNDGAIGGAGNIASGQVLYGTAAGVAGTSANLLFSNTASRLTVGNSLAADNAGILTQGSGTIRWQASPGGGGGFVIQNNSNTGIFFNNLSSTLAFLANTGNLLLGTTTDDGTNRLQVAGSVAVTTNIAATRTILSSSSTAPQIRLNVTGQSGYWEIYSDFNNTNADLWFRPNGTGTASSFTQVNSSGNWAFGTTAANTFKIDIAASGSSGTLRAYDQTPTTGATQLIVRAGAGQSTTNLLTVQNSGGTALVGITGGGSFFTGNNANATGDSLIDANGLRFGSTVVVCWSNNLPFNAADLSLSRSTTNTLQVGDGGSNANGIVSAASYRAPLTTPASATATGTTGTIVWDANYIYIATGTNTWKRVAIATW